MDCFTCDEVRSVIKKLKRGKAAGADDIPGEYLQALMNDTSALSWLTDLFNHCWQSRTIPADWRRSVVTCLYKKGGVEHCQNYRPISLLSVAYKLLAGLILKRMQEGGAEERLHDFQFGFRRNVGTADAIFCARRQVELAMALKDGKTAMLALDWKMAFDSINPDVLVTALNRFGFNADLTALIRNIYEDRSFRVREGEGFRLRSPRPQGFRKDALFHPSFLR